MDSDKIDQFVKEYIDAVMETTTMGDIETSDVRKKDFKRKMRAANSYSRAWAIRRVKFGKAGHSDG